MQQQITALRTVAATDAIGVVAAATAPHSFLFLGTAAVVAICALSAVAAIAAFPLL